MSRSTVEYLRHILDEANYLSAEGKITDKESFLQNETLKRAFTRSLEVMGEAVKGIPDDFKQAYPQVEWRSIAAMRDRLIHHYFGVDYDIVWDAVINNVPKLREDITKILEDQPPEPTAD